MAMYREIREVEAMIFEGKQSIQAIIDMFNPSAIQLIPTEFVIEPERTEYTEPEYDEEGNETEPAKAVYTPAITEARLILDLTFNFGTIRATEKDYIVKDSADNIYSYPPDDFESRFEVIK